MTVKELIQTLQSLIEDEPGIGEYGVCRDLENNDAVSHQRVSFIEVYKDTKVLNLK